MSKTLSPLVKHFNAWINWFSQILGILLQERLKIKEDFPFTKRRKKVRKVCIWHVKFARVPHTNCAKCGNFLRVVPNPLCKLEHHNGAMV